MREVKENQVYRHFKGHLIKVVCLAKDSETLKEQVVYYHLDEENPVYWVRDKEMFLSKVDKDKYPDIKQEYRFELVSE